MNYRQSILLCAAAGVLSLVLAQVTYATTLIRMETVEGNIDLQLLDEDAPETVFNFVANYIDKGAFDNSFIQRTQSLVPDGKGIIQGGGYVWNADAPAIEKIPIAETIPSEYGLENDRGTIAMALVGGDVDSGSNQWFINTTDNREALDNQGLTVFGFVLNGLDTVDRLAALPLEDTSTLPENDTLALQAPFDFSFFTIAEILRGNFGSMPLIDYISGPIQRQHVALISKVRVLVRGPLGSVGTPFAMPGGKFGMLSLSQFDSDVSVDSVASVANPDLDGAPEGIVFGQGFFEFKLSNVTTDSVSVVLSLPDDLTDEERPNTYYKYGPTPDNPNPHWYEFMYDAATGTGAVFGEDMVALVFVDGARGDDDLEKNGFIEDVGAPGIGPVVSGSGGGGGIDLWSALAGLFAVGWKMRGIGARLVRNRGQTGMALT